jgi:3-oxoacyl-[acyl-carrier protein] reductase
MSATPLRTSAGRPLPGRVGLVTGAGRGIGRAVALALADAGFRVVLGARTVSQVGDVASEVIRRGGEALAVHLDVTDPQSVDEFVGTAMDRFGRVDVLVNNAGSNNGGENGAVGPIGEINPGAWWTDIEVNLRGTFLCTHSVLPPMASGGGGHIINVVWLTGRFLSVDWDLPDLARRAADIERRDVLQLRFVPD